MFGLLNPLGPISQMVWPSGNAEKEAYSKQNRETIKFGFTIDDFTELVIPNGSKIRSIPFKCGGYEWFVVLYPNGDTTDDKDHVSVFLHLKKNSTESTSVNIKYEINLLDTEDHVIHSTGQRIHSFIAAGGIGFRLSRSYVLDKSKGILTDDKLKIEVKLTVAKDVESGLRDKQKKRTVLYNDNLIMTDFSKFWVDQTLTDVEIEDANGELKLRAHKIILAQQSPVFAKMFTSQMSEGLTNRAKLSIDAATLNELLYFIYYSKINQTENVELIKKLLDAAEKYELIPLKKPCESLLIQILGQANAIELLEYGQLYNCTALKKSALRCIEINKDGILKTPEFKEFFLRNPDSAQEAMCQAANVKWP